MGGAGLSPAPPMYVEEEDVPEHGRTGTYTRGCRCAECRKAWADYKREYNARQPKVARKQRNTGPCSIEGCHLPLKARGYCVKHYQRFRRHGDPLAGGTPRNFKGGQRCLQPGCERESVALGYCGTHVNRLRRGIPLDYEPKGRYISSGGYVLVLVDGRRVLEHRLVMECYLGRPLIHHEPGRNILGETIHHKNGDRQDNRIENLELWSQAQRPGQRAIDKLEWAREIVALYGPLAEAGLI